MTSLAKIGLNLTAELKNKLIGSHKFLIIRPGNNKYINSMNGACFGNKTFTIIGSSKIIINDAIKPYAISMI